MQQALTIAKQGMSVIYRRCLTKDEHWATARSQHKGSNKHGKSAKDIRFTDLEKLLDMAETASGNNVQIIQSTCYRNST